MEEQTKRCTKCGEEYPLTAEYWHRDKSKRDGFRVRCKACEREYQRKNYEANPEYLREWRKSNPDKVSEHSRQWRKSHPDKAREINHQWREANIEKARESCRKWRKANPAKNRIRVQEYQNRIHRLPHAYTPDDWNYALTYFNGCCAVCGRQLNDLFGEHTAAMDHWIPLSSDDCPGTIPENIIPLCHGVGGCNNSKSAKDPEVWLIETYGTRKARQIMARIQAYFDSLGDDEDVA